MSAPTGMCPHCGRIVHITKGGLTYRHLSDDEHGRTIVPCPGARQNPRCAESDARPLWNGKPNPHRARSLHPDALWGDLGDPEVSNG